MKCPTCGYEIPPFESTCIRCAAQRTAPRPQDRMGPASLSTPRPVPPSPPARAARAASTNPRGQKVAVGLLAFVACVALVSWCLGLAGGNKEPETKPTVAPLASGPAVTSPRPSLPTQTTPPAVTYPQPQAPVVTYTPPVQSYQAPAPSYGSCPRGGAHVPGKVDRNGRTHCGKCGRYM